MKATHIRGDRVVLRLYFSCGWVKIILYLFVFFFTKFTGDVLYATCFGSFFQQSTAKPSSHNNARSGTVILELEGNSRLMGLLANIALSPNKENQFAYQEEVSYFRMMFEDSEKGIEKEVQAARSFLKRVERYYRCCLLPLPVRNFLNWTGWKDSRLPSKPRRVPTGFENPFLSGLKHLTINHGVNTDSISDGKKFRTKNWSAEDDLSFQDALSLLQGAQKHLQGITNPKN
jgi:hypothetical protein